jgi:rare lipoprotein A
MTRLMQLLIIAVLAAARVHAQAPQSPEPPKAPPQSTTPAPVVPAPGPSAIAPVAPAPAAGSAPAATPATGTESGRIAYYGRKFAGRKTASGERYNPNAMTMAHKSLPFGTKVRVTNKTNGKSVELRVNDRGPRQGDRLGDVSLAASRKLGFGKAGAIDADIVVVSSPKT